MKTGKRDFNFLHKHKGRSKHIATTLTLSQDSRRFVSSSRAVAVVTPAIPEQREDLQQEFDHLSSYILDSAINVESSDGSEPTEDFGVYYTRPIGPKTPPELYLFMPFRDEYLDELIRGEGRQGEGTHCEGCQGEGGNFRCVEEECFGLGMRCSSCMVDAHKHLPLHWLEEWNGSFFENATLQHLGLSVQLGHRAGQFCIFPEPVELSVMHTNGMHVVNAQFCGCQAGLERRTQLLRSRWWPATVTSPQSATTFTCLRQFHNLSCVGKIPAYDYYKALEAMTENRTRVRPKERYRTLLHSMVQWRHLKMLKRAGRGHDPSGVTGTKPGELAVECPACPHPGRNLPPDWRTWPKELQYLFNKFVATDANFRLRNKIVSNLAKNPNMGDGWAYFVPYGEYIEWVKQFVDQTEISSCSGFAAIFLANLKNVKGLRTTGVAGCCCGRHGFWLPNGIGDLQNGERYCNMDWVLAQAIKGEDFSMIILSYDIACQWGINFWKRLDELRDKIDVRLTEENLVFLIPKFHLPAHQTSCQTPYSFHYCPGVGETHGEVIEENWAASNKAASQTKEMAPGNRAVTLEDVFGAHNYRLLQSIDQLLAKRLLAAFKESQQQQEGFNRFSEGLKANIPEHLLGEWENMVVTWEKDHSKACPYETSNDDRNSFKKVEILLAKEEHEAIARGTMVHSSSAVVFLVLGIEIEEKQRQIALELKITRTLTPTQTLQLQKQRSTVLRLVNKFRTLQAVFMPRLRDFLTAAQSSHFEAPDTDFPEKIKLFMPSELENESVRNGVCSGRIWEKEAQLRQGEAVDALNAVRQGLRARTVTNTFKVKNVTGQRHNTRAQGVLRQIDTGINSGKVRYRYARNALMRLWGGGEWEKVLQDLKEADVRGLNERALTAEELARNDLLREGGLLNEIEAGGVASPGVAVVRGETGRTLSWIWYGASVDPNDPEFQDALRVEWCKARARTKRWNEEVMLLCEEIRRVQAFALWKASWWKDQVDRRTCGSEELREGITAYALQHADFEQDRANRVGKRWDGLIAHARSSREDIPNFVELFADVMQQDDVGDDDEI